MNRDFQKLSLDFQTCHELHFKGNAVVVTLTFVSLMNNPELLLKYITGCHQVDPLTRTEDPPAGQWSSHRCVRRQHCFTLVY